MNQIKMGAANLLTKEDVIDFLKGKGFRYISSGNGCGEFHKSHPFTPTKGIQINAEGLTSEFTAADPFSIGIFTCADVDGKWEYQETYKNFNELFQNENHLIQRHEH